MSFTNPYFDGIRLFRSKAHCLWSEHCTLEEGVKQVVVNPTPQKYVGVTKMNQIMETKCIIF